MSIYSKSFLPINLVVTGQARIPSLMELPPLAENSPLTTDFVSQDYFSQTLSGIDSGMNLLEEAGSRSFGIFSPDLFENKIPNQESKNKIKEHLDFVTQSIGKENLFSFLSNVLDWEAFGQKIEYLDRLLSDSEGLKRFPDHSYWQGLVLNALRLFQNQIGSYQKELLQIFDESSQIANDEQQLQSLIQFIEFCDALEGLNLNYIKPYLSYGNKWEFLELFPEDVLRRAAFLSRQKSKERLWDFLDLPQTAPDNPKSLLTKEWRDLAEEMESFSLERGSGEFESYENLAFQIKFFQDPFREDVIWGQRALELYQKLTSDRDRIRFLQVLLYCPNQDEMQFLLENLNLYHDKFYDFGDFIGSLYSDFNSEYVTGYPLRGFYFELQILDVFSQKGYSIEVIQAGPQKRMENGSFQEIDMHILARDESGQKIEFYLEVYSGKGSPSRKKEQVDRYVSASKAMHIGVGMVTKWDKGDEMSSSRGVEIPMWHFSALQMIDGKSLAEQLFGEYEEYWSQF